MSRGRRKRIRTRAIRRAMLQRRSTQSSLSSPPVICEVRRLLLTSSLSSLPTLKNGSRFGRNRDGRAGARVAPRVGLVRTDREAAEPADLDAFALLEGLRHGLEDAVDHQLRTSLRQLAARGHRVDELTLGHGQNSGLRARGADFPMEAAFWRLVNRKTSAFLGLKPS